MGRRMWMVGVVWVATGMPVTAQVSGVVEVPLRLHEGRLVVTAESADGRSHEFFLGTGSPTTVLSESGAAVVGDGPLTLAGLDVPLEGHQVLPDDQLAAGGTTYAGMIASNTLNQYEVLVDLPNGRLLLGPIGRRARWEGVELSDPIPLRVFHGAILSLDIEFGGRPYPAMLDLGTPGVLVNERVIEETGIDGSGTLRVAGATVPDVPVRVSDNPVIARFSPDGDGFVIVGTPLLQGCAVAISFVHRELRSCVR